jgi:O-acetylserine/cysteine efflux transporter
MSAECIRMNRTEWLSALLITALWGLNFSFIKLGVAHLDPLLLAGLRFALCALPLMLWVPRPELSWRWLLSYGLAFGVGTWGLMTVALRIGLAPGLAAWLLQASAFLTPLLAMVCLREPLTRRQWQGALLALLGFFGVLGATQGEAPWAGLLAALFAALSLSVANLVVRASGARDMLGLMVWASPFAALPLLAVVAAQHGAAPFAALPEQLRHPQALASLLFQVYPVTLLGYWVWNRLLARHGAAAVAPTALMVPVFALAFAGLLFGRWPNVGQWLGIACIALGVAHSAGLFKARAAIATPAKRCAAG